eukprot:11320768-Prorocentrum_lima.AAC.1
MKKASRAGSEATCMSEVEVTLTHRPDGRECDCCKKRILRLAQFPPGTSADGTTHQRTRRRRR